MRIISLIHDIDVIEDILWHVGIGEDSAFEHGYDPPDAYRREKPPLIYELVYDDFQTMPEEYPGHERLQ